MLSQRTPWQVTRSVWHALFMREVLARTTANRMAWFWMILEPVAHIALLTGIRALVGNFRFIAGAPVLPWLVVGLMTFFVYRDGVLRSVGAISANKGLFTYRQVKPVDTVLARCVVEFILKILVFSILLLAMGLLGYDAVPENILLAIACFTLVWLFGVGNGLLASVCAELIPEVGRIIRISMFPVYLVSGVLFPLNFLPEYLQIYVLLNPLVHGIETIRMAFFLGYWTLDGVDISYLIYSVFILLSLGLLFQVRFREKMKAL